MNYAIYMNGILASVAYSKPSGAEFFFYRSLEPSFFYRSSEPSFFYRSSEPSFFLLKSGAELWFKFGTEFFLLEPKAELFWLKSP